jgi:hypothetical protein
VFSRNERLYRRQKALVDEVAMSGAVQANVGDHGLRPWVANALVVVDDIRD